MNWLKKKMKNFSGRITTRFVIILLLMMLPIYIYTSILNSYVIKTMQEKIVQSVQSVQENYITLINNRLDITSYVLWAMKYENEYEAEMLRQTDDETYALYRARFYQDMKQVKSFSDGMDTYFYMNKNREDIMLWGSGDAEKELVWNEYKAGKLAKGYSLKNINGRESLFLYLETGNVGYGGWIWLDE
ncbi:MAG: hypothetical protein J6C37_09840, partial [Roseburia sp.]|nr:hypothetical protein [Roseburia sp.]